MARPIKNNADYFTHDADMRDDPRIKALRRKFKYGGYGLWCMLLELITDSDNFRLKLDLEIIAGDLDVDPVVLEELIKYCIQLGLFQADAEFKTLWSKTLDKRFETLLSKRKRERNDSSDELSPAETNYLHEVIADDNTQSRVEYSKAFVCIALCKIFGKEYQAEKERLPAMGNFYNTIDEQARLILTVLPADSATKQIDGYIRYCKKEKRKMIGTDHKAAETILSSDWIKLLGEPPPSKKFEDAELNKSLWTLKAWEDFYRIRLDNSGGDPKENKDFRKHFGYGELPIGNAMAGNGKR